MKETRSLISRLLQGRPHLLLSPPGDSALGELSD